MELTFPETALHEVQMWTVGVWSHNMTPSDLQSHIFRKKKHGSETFLYLSPSKCINE